MPEFIIGTWDVVSINDTETGNILDIIYPFIEIRKNDISYGDTYHAKYRFIDKNSIFIDDLRITGGEVWRFERKSEGLIAYTEWDNYRTTITLKRH